jgi:dolichyl-diphosphooligosaccharide--protein glycosyltransferase
MAKNKKKAATKKTKNVDKQEVKKTETKSEKAAAKPQEKPKKTNFLENKYVKYSIPIILILIAMIFSYSVRSGPVSLDGLEDNVRSNIKTNIRSIIEQELQMQYSGSQDPLFNQYLQEEVDKKYNQAIESGKINLGGVEYDIEKLIQDNTANLKQSFKFDNNQTYLTAIDPYYFLRKAENVDRTGTPGDVVIDGQAYETLQRAPNEKKISSEPQFHIWLESLFVDSEKDDGENTKAIFTLSTILAVLSIIPVFFIIKKYSNDLTAFFGTMVLMFVGTFVSRTQAGFVDTDAYTILFSLLIVLPLVYGLFSKKYLFAGIFALMAGLMQSIYIWAWGPGWFIYVLILASFVLYMVYIVVNNYLIKKKISIDREIIKNKILFLTYLISSYIFTLLIASREMIGLIRSGLSGYATDLSTISSNIWPNVESSIAELNPASFNSIIGSVGGQIIFLIALFGLLALSLNFKNANNKQKFVLKIIAAVGIIYFLSIISGNMFVSLTSNNPLWFIIILFVPIIASTIYSITFSEVEKERIFILILLSAWVAGTIYMSLNGVRFILLLAAPFAISLGLGLYYIFKYINTSVSKEMHIKGNLASQIPGAVVIIIIFLFLFIPMYNSAVFTTKNTVPNFDDSWYDTMYQIKDETSKDAIITSWWDFGHYFATIADRGVTFDGASQRTPPAHWVGKLFMENDQNVSHDILRMLICGNNKAFDTMLSYTENKNDADAVKVNKILYETFGKDKDETRKVIENNKYYEFTNDQVNEIMEYLACDTPRENLVITSEDMIGKAGVWAHWGSWDFTKKYTLNNYKSKTAQEIADDIDENVTLIEEYVNALKNIDQKASDFNIKREDLVNQWLAPYPTYLGEANWNLKNETILVGAMAIVTDGAGRLQGLAPTTPTGTKGCININTNQLICNFELETENMTFISGDLPIDLNIKRFLMPSINGNDLETVSERDIDAGYDLYISPMSTGNGVKVGMAQYPLGGSLFTKLFYMGGFGADKFEIFSSREGATGNRITVWKTKWTQEEPEVKDITDFVDFNVTNVEIDDLLNESN